MSEKTCHACSYCIDVRDDGWALCDWYDAMQPPWLDQVRDERRVDPSTAQDCASFWSAGAALEDRP